jgi:hypothetical protein
MAEVQLEPWLRALITTTTTTNNNNNNKNMIRFLKAIFRLNIKHYI